MRYELPEGHGLSQKVVAQLVFTEGDKLSLTNAQHAALEQGVGRGESLLVVSPTSTGKTQIAAWAIARGIEQGLNVVYLVTHRALAKQKVNEFRTKFLAEFLANDPSSLVVATGDYVEDCAGVSPPAPLQTPLLVATYEKYLALLSAAGTPSDMRRTIVVCDEIQLIGDEHRGQNVEVLLALLKNAGWRQFLGLSAVLDPKDARHLAEWLEVKLLVASEREKHICYQCWTVNGLVSVRTDRPDEIIEGVPLPGGQLRTKSILLYLLAQKKPPLPIIVFCMKKQDTFDLAGELLEHLEQQKGPQLSLVFETLPETNANSFLSRTVANRIAIHTADLTEEEREIVEVQLEAGKLDVVFATSTLAAGVNFPLGAAVFAGWQRWDGQQKQRVPIPASEFHNMCGRVGRMGYDHVDGLAIFTATNSQELRAARSYLDLSSPATLEPRVEPARFGQLVLQLVASNICGSVEQVHRLVASTFSAIREQDKNPVRYRKWAGAIDSRIEELVRTGLLLHAMSGKLAATHLGRAVGHSGLMPETGVFLANYARNRAGALSALLPSPIGGDVRELGFLLFAACLSSPEFRGTSEVPRTRYLPFPLEDQILFDATRHAANLPDPVWQADPGPINCAKFTLDWIEGTSLRELEGRAKYLSAGMLHELHRNLAWCLQGFASIVEALSEGPVEGTADALSVALRKLPRVIRRLAHRVSEGLPDDALWLRQLGSGQFYLGRHEILGLRGEGLHRPEALALGSQEADSARIKVFAKAKPSPQAKANWARDAAREWKIRQRREAKERHLKRASRCPDRALVAKFYDSKGKDFERAFEEALRALGITLRTLDDGSKTGAPDYLLEIPGCAPLVVELKSRDGDSLVDYNKAVEVLAAAEVHGFRDAFCVTLCHPGVDPSVPLVISGCGRLCVVESCDLAEALLRLCAKALTLEQLWRWLASPGQALSEDLPWKEYAPPS